VEIFGWPYDWIMSEKQEAAPRIVEANRLQTRLVPMDLEGLLPEDHQARAVWAFVARLDLSGFHERIKAREGSAGRPAIDPQILLGLWILAMLDGVGAAREIERLCHYHLAYQWMCGGVHVNHHTLSDFRNLSSDQLNGLLTQTVSALLSEGLVEMHRVAQDGMKVRASAGGSSFRRRGRLEAFKKIAREQIEGLAQEIEDNSGAASKREQSARKRCAESRERRVERALEELNKAESQKRSKDAKRKKKEKRASITDPEARVMKMADGGFRPAYNVHLTTATGANLVVAVEVNNEGTDQTTMVQLAEQIENRHGVRPKEWLADAGCTSLRNIDEMDKRGCKVYAPLRASQSPNRKSADRRRSDSPAVREWRERMESEEAKAIYKQRGATAEWVNAQLRSQGLVQILVRGVKKTLAVALLHAITHNMRRSWALQTA
jgi:transposase